jgi:hypothetical protein
MHASIPESAHVEVFMIQSAANLIRMVPLMEERGGFPQDPLDTLRALRWGLERFSEMVDWDDYVACQVIDGAEPFHKSMMTMRLERGQYDGTDGDLLYQFDALVQARIDPNEDVSR